MIENADVSVSVFAVGLDWAPDSSNTTPTVY